MKSLGAALGAIPDCAALHPGYGMLSLGRRNILCLFPDVSEFGVPLNLTARFRYLFEWTCIEGVRPTLRKQAFSR
jgi:hypothetical protein